MNRTMLVTTWVTRPRTAQLLALAAGAAVFALGGASGPVADSADRGVVCSSDVVSGVEVDNCVGNPNADTTTDAPGYYPEVVPEFRFGLGF